MTDTRKIEPKIRRDIKDKGFDLENLLYRWIEDLLIYYDSENLVFGKFRVNSIKKVSDEEYIIEANAWGEEFDENKHERRTIVKAITYAQMKIEKINGVWRATFVVDI